jgi:hypothetical protein
VVLMAAGLLNPAGRVPVIGSDMRDGRAASCRTRPLSAFVNPFLRREAGEGDHA